MSELWISIAVAAIAAGVNLIIVGRMVGRIDTTLIHFGEKLGTLDKDVDAGLIELKASIEKVRDKASINASAIAVLQDRSETTGEHRARAISFHGDR